MTFFAGEGYLKKFYEKTKDMTPEERGHYIEEDEVSNCFWNRIVKYTRLKMHVSRRLTYNGTLADTLCDVSTGMRRLVYSFVFLCRSKANYQFEC